MINFATKRSSSSNTESRTIHHSSHMPNFMDMSEIYQNRNKLKSLIKQAENYLPKKTNLINVDLAVSDMQQQLEASKPTSVPSMA